MLIRGSQTPDNRFLYGVKTRSAVKNEAIMPQQRKARRIRSFLSSVSWARRSFSVIRCPLHMYVFSANSPSQRLKCLRTTLPQEVFPGGWIGNPMPIPSPVGASIDVLCRYPARPVTRCQECAYPVCMRFGSPFQATTKVTTYPPRKEPPNPFANHVETGDFSTANHHHDPALWMRGEV